MTETTGTAGTTGRAGTTGALGAVVTGGGGLTAQVRALAEGTVSSRALTEETLRRIAATQPTLNAFRVVRAEAALQEAEEADRRLAAGESGPLLGVPVAVKDDMDVAGEPTAFGCAGAFPPKPADSEAVRRFRAAGAVIVGKTNTPELGQWPVTNGPAFGVTRNPWSLAHTPGGSSGGAAAAVAAGLVPAALGSDGAGSVRIPAAWTHLVGIKPQRGRISTWPEPEAFRGLTCYGPLARTVADAALLLHAASGPHERDLHRPASVDLLAAAGREPGRRLRVALSFRPAFAAVRHRLDPVVRDATVRTAELLESLGHEVVEEDPPYGPVGLTFVPRSMSGVRDWARRAPDRTLLDARTHANAQGGLLFGGGVLRVARAAEAPLRRRVGEMFGRYDVILTPTNAVPPLRADELAGLGSRETNARMIAACPYAWPWNVLGWPAVSVPSGFTAGGLPMGAQLLGPAGGEPLLISLAAQLEAVERWYERWPEQAAEGEEAAA
ncbi:amidase [Streptomyces cinnamoneus]|uniref:Amidase n=1 Tax=Streptomyces cinnamoneus TaxID=53446 RepID=A0A2G1XEK4_STRCJ|nr:amidase [Streptomyces cinnamoneus]PHQ49635.1 amidase [Streptomyces cinnamoneus]PPT14644.1 amidase [Streptomyces cinnamoneus]